MPHKILMLLAFSAAASVAAFAGNGHCSPTSLGCTEVVIAQPIDLSTINGQVPVIASATSPHGAINYMDINVDSRDVYNVSSNHINTMLNLSTGTHQIYVKAWDTQHNYYDMVVHVNVTNGNHETTVSGIEKMGGWQSCDTCAGPGGHGSRNGHGIIQHVASPSLDGNATEYWLHPYNPYSNVLNFIPLGGVNGPVNFTLDFDFWIGDASVAQGFEMDIFYARNGKKNFFLTECDSRGNHAGTWQVSDAVHDSWQHTGLPCHINSYSWNHVKLQFLRQNDGNTRFVTVAMNGDTQYVNRTYAAANDGSFQMNPALQLDSDEHPDAWKVFVDNMTIKYW
ncbi:MAG: hypothetical protein ABI383_03340 [Acidobacteriaceae bacterium]